MPDHYITLTLENLEQEHLCCAIADKKHQQGVDGKKAWLAAQLPLGHVFRKLDARGKVFIEYVPVEHAWAPVEGPGWLYIHCLWVSGSYKGQGHARALLEGCLQDARAQGRAGVCVISASKKKPFLSEKGIFTKFGFTVADRLEGGYELLALSLDGSLPRFADTARAMRIPGQGLTIYYSPQCPYIPDCLRQVQAVCKARGLPLHLIPVTDAAQAKAMPCVFNNWAVFYKGRFQTLHLLNEGYLLKMLVEQGERRRQFVSPLLGVV